MDLLLMAVTDHILFFSSSSNKEEHVYTCTQDMAQPSATDIDRFRLAFFQQVIEQEETKKKQDALRQRMCHHRYQPTGCFTPTGHAEFLCSRCEHVRLSPSSFFLRGH